MEFLRNQIIKLIVLAQILSLVSIVKPQVRSSKGFLVGGAAYAPETNRSYGTPARWVIVEVKRANRIITIRSNEMGLFGEYLTVGIYKLVRVKSLDGVELDLDTGQQYTFKINKNKNTRFDIALSAKKN